MWKRFFLIVDKMIISRLGKKDKCNIDDIVCPLFLVSKETHMTIDSSNNVGVGFRTNALIWSRKCMRSKQDSSQIVDTSRV